MSQTSKGRLRRAAALLLLAIPLSTACQSSLGEPDRFSMSGVWEGSGADFSLTASVVEREDGMVLGSGVITSSAVAFTARIEGERRQTEVALTLVIDNEPDISFLGVLSGSARIDGALTGAGFQNAAVTLNRRSEE